MVLAIISGGTVKQKLTNFTCFFVIFLGGVSAPFFMMALGAFLSYLELILPLDMMVANLNYKLIVVFRYLCIIE